jgi:hypothetical protein
MNGHQVARRIIAGATLVAIGGFFVSSFSACDTESGSGSVRGKLDVPDCWSGDFDLEPDFFGAAPFQKSLSIRVQRGSDFVVYSDGFSMLISDVFLIRGMEGLPSQYGVPLNVGLPPEVTPPGTPVVANPSPPPVSMTVYLNRSCRTRNSTLNAVTEVLLDENGECQRPNISRCALPPAARPSLDNVPRGRSFITFTSLPNNRVDEPEAKERLVDAAFDVYLADVREACPGEPPPCQGKLRGDLKFYYQRGRPAQVFP